MTFLESQLSIGIENHYSMLAHEEVLTDYGAGKMVYLVKAFATTLDNLN